MRRWATDAAAAGLSVDVWIALKLEWALVREDISQPRLEVVVGKARQRTSAPKLAPSDEFRRWLAYLSRGSRSQAEHDLPSVAIPARVVARIPPRLLETRVVDAANEPLDPGAIVVEHAAVLEGMTMESWAYRSLAVTE
jgi:ribosomal protein L22